MVRTRYVVKNLSREDVLPKAFAYQKIVDTPACIPEAGTSTIRPPAIFHLVRVLKAPSVDESRAEKLREFRTFLVGKSRIEMVRRRILEVYLLVSHIHVAAHHDRFSTLHGLYESAKGVFPAHPIIQSP